VTQSNAIEAGDHVTQFGTDCDIAELRYVTVSASFGTQIPAQWRRFARGLSACHARFNRMGAAGSAKSCSKTSVTMI